MSTITAYESEYELLKFRLFIYYHTRKFLDSYKNSKFYVGSNISNLYALTSCGFNNSVFSEYIYTRMYFNYNKIGFFSKSVKFDKYQNIINNECEFLRKSQDKYDILTEGNAVMIKKSIKKKIKKMSGTDRGTVQRKCLTHVQKIFDQDKIIIEDWINEIEDSKPIHNYYNHKRVIEDLKIISNKLSDAKIGDIKSASSFDYCERIGNFVPLMHYKKVVEIMLNDLNIDEEESHIVPDKDNNFLSFLKFLTIRKDKQKDDLDFLRSYENRVGDNELDMSFIKLLKKINEVSSKSSQIGEKTVSVMNKYKFLEKKKKEYEKHKSFLEQNIEELVDRLNKARKDVNMMKNVKIQDIDSAQFVASEALQKKLKEVESMEKDEESLRKYNQQYERKITDVEKKIKDLDREMTDMEDRTSFGKFMKSIGKKDTPLEVSEKYLKEAKEEIKNLPENAEQDKAKIEDLMRRLDEDEDFLNKKIQEEYDASNRIYEKLKKKHNVNMKNKKKEIQVIYEKEFGKKAPKTLEGVRREKTKKLKEYGEQIGRLKKKQLEENNFITPEGKEIVIGEMDRKFNEAKRERDQDDDTTFETQEEDDESQVDIQEEDDDTTFETQEDDDDESQVDTQEDDDDDTTVDTRRKQRRVYDEDDILGSEDVDFNKKNKFHVSGTKRTGKKTYMDVLKDIDIPGVEDEDDEIKEIEEDDINDEDIEEIPQKRLGRQRTKKNISHKLALAFFNKNKNNLKSLQKYLDENHLPKGTFKIFVDQIKKLNKLVSTGANENQITEKEDNKTDSLQDRLMKKSTVTRRGNVTSLQIPAVDSEDINLTF